MLLFRVLIGHWMLYSTRDGRLGASEAIDQAGRMLLRELSLVVIKAVRLGASPENAEDIDLTAGRLPKNGKIA